MTTLPILLLSLAAAAPAAPAGSAQDNLNGVLLDFTASWCGPCQTMSPIVHKLQRQGYPVRKVDIDKERALAQRFNISSIPAFVLVVDGREVDRVVGMTSEQQLKQMLAQIPARPAQDVAAAPPAASTAPVSAKGKFLPSVNIPFFRPKAAEQPAEPEAVAAAIATTRDVRGQNPDNVAVATDPLSTSIRIKVKDGDGVNFGTGTIIESKPGRTVILTCGHVFRDVKETAVIEVDVFRGGKFRTYLGNVVTYDLQADVGLMTIPTDAPLGCCPIAPIDRAVAEGQHVYSIGCSRGDAPTRLQMRVTKLNRYRGPDNIECTVAPVPGRSGGGLFNAEGEVVGVCFAADNENKCGLYAGLRPVHQLLHKAGFGHLCPGSTPSPQVELVDAEHQEPAANGTPPGTRLVQETANIEGQTQAAATQRTGESEVICIIRSLDDPQAASRVVVINRASPKFMAYLNGELASQPRPTMQRVESTEPPQHAQTGFRGTAAVDPFLDSPIPTTNRSSGGRAASVPQRYIRSAASR